MIDPITQLILEDEATEEKLDHILEGYDLGCQECGRVISIIKDGEGSLACCNQRMIVMGSNPVDPTHEAVGAHIAGDVVGSGNAARHQVQIDLPNLALL